MKPQKEWAFPPPGLHTVSGGRGGASVLKELRRLTLQQQLVITNLRMFANKTLLIPEIKRRKAFLDSGGKFQEKKKKTETWVVREKGLTG